MKKEHPILFSTPMVQAILQGRKTQTRRIIKLRDGTLPNDSDISTHLDGITFEKVMDFSKTYPYWQELPCPYGHPGDRLWVRETFWKNIFDNSICYLEDMRPEHEPFWVKKPSIHMPRAASRILLEITEIRVQRLLDITPEDALQEGCRGPRTINEFGTLWETINGPHSWEQNPWVWAITFKRI